MPWERCFFCRPLSRLLMSFKPEATRPGIQTLVIPIRRWYLFPESLLMFRVLCPMDRQLQFLPDYGVVRYLDRLGCRMVKPVQLRQRGRSPVVFLRLMVITFSQPTLR